MSIRTAPLTLAVPEGLLAMAWAQAVASDLALAWPELQVRCEVVRAPGTGHLPNDEAKVARVEAIRRAVVAGRADVAVHAFENVPTGPAPGLAVPAIPQRADPRDVLVSLTGKVFTYLPDGARIGTNSRRRSSQLLRRRSDLQIVPLHGDVDGRLAALRQGAFDAIVLGAADLWRLGRLGVITEYFDTDLMIPAPGQGALALEVREADARTAAHLAPLHDASTAYAVRAERACLARLGGGVNRPIGVFATTDGEDMFIHGIVASLDGTRAARLRWGGPWREAEEVGSTLAELLSQIGAPEILSGKPIPPTTRYALRPAPNPRR